MNHEKIKKIFGIANKIYKNWTKVEASGKQPVI
jgi:hypothetical protein